MKVKAENAIGSFLSAIAAERGASKNTLDAYRRDLSDYERVLGLSGADVLRSQTDNIEAYLAALLDEGFARATRARRLSAIRQLHLFLYEEGWRKDDPTTRIGAPGRDKKLPGTLSVEEVERLLAAAGNGEGLKTARLVCLMELLYSTGLRVSELVSLPVTPLRRDPRSLVVRGKGGKDRMVILSERAQKAVAAYLPFRDKEEERLKQKSAFLFPSRGKEGHLTRVRFFQMIRELAAEAGLDPKSVSPHTLRHAFATHLLANGADLRVIQTLLGHADIATTEIYTHILQDDLKTLVLEHHPLAQSGYTS